VKGLRVLRSRRPGAVLQARVPADGHGLVPADRDGRRWPRLEPSRQPTNAESPWKPIANQPSVEARRVHSSRHGTIMPVWSRSHGPSPTLVPTCCCAGPDAAVPPMCLRVPDPGPAGQLSCRACSHVGPSCPAGPLRHGCRTYCRVRRRAGPVLGCCCHSAGRAGAAAP
jgi:hypothetical protein